MDAETLERTGADPGARPGQAHDAAAAEIRDARGALRDRERIVELRRRAARAIRESAGRVRIALDRKVDDLPRLRWRAFDPDTDPAESCDRFQAELDAAGALLESVRRARAKEAEATDALNAAEAEKAAAADRVAQLEAADAEAVERAERERRERETEAVAEAERRRRAGLSRDELAAERDAERALDEAIALEQGGVDAWRARE